MNPLEIDDQKVGIEGDEDLDNALDSLLDDFTASFIASLRKQKYPIQRKTGAGDIMEITRNTALDAYTASDLVWLKEPELPEYARALAKRKPLSYIQLGSNASAGADAERYERPIVQADEKTWTVFCDGIALSTSIKYLEIRLVRFFKFSEQKWKQFCESIAKNASLTKIAFLNTRLDMLSKDRLEELCLALKSNRTLKKLNLQSNFLGDLNESKFDMLFSYLFSAEIAVTTLDIRHNELADLPDNLWAKYCNYLATNTSYKALKLNNGSGRDASQRKKRVIELGKALTKNTGIKELCYYATSSSSLKESDEETLQNFKNDCVNIIENSPAHKMQIIDLDYIGSKAELNEIIWKRLCEAISKNQYLTALDINSTPKEGKAEINKMIQTKTKDRHSKTFALAHCLHKLRFKNNPIHSALHKGLISNILTYFEVRPLCERVEIELKPFAAKLESKPFN